MVELSRKDALMELDELKRRIQELEARMTTTRERADTEAPELITLAEAAELTGRSYRTMERWVEMGLLQEEGRIAAGMGRPRIQVRKDRVLELSRMAGPNRFRRIPT